MAAVWAEGVVAAIKNQNRTRIRQILTVKQNLRNHAVILAALLQVLPIIRNLVTSPAANSTIAFILRWGIGAGAVVGGVDAVSGATNYFTSTNVFTGTVGTFFTNNLTLKTSGTDGGASTVITSNSVSVILSVNGGSTNFAMPPGLLLKLVDGTSGNNPVYDIIYGTPTQPSTNTFAVTLQYQSLFVSTNITIKILAAASSIAPTITNNPVSVTNVAGGNATFTVRAGGSAPLAYQWFFNTNTALSKATNASLPLNAIRASQTGSYLVIITNAGGSVTSTPASLVVTNPLPATLTTPANNGGVFQFTFIPVVGLTNSVLTNSVLFGGDWAVLTNVPPPATASPITVADPLGGSNRFYRVQVSP